MTGHRPTAMSPNRRQNSLGRVNANDLTDLQILFIVNVHSKYEFDFMCFMFLFLHVTIKHLKYHH